MRTHGPHVDKRDNPRDAFVKVTIHLEDGRAVTIERGLDKPKEPKVSPEDAEPDIRWLSAHPEIALSRRELIKFILVEPGERSKAIQALLTLERLDEARWRNLTSAANSPLLETSMSAVQDVEWTKPTHFLTAAGITALKTEDVLAEANRRRQMLGLTKLTELTATTKLAEGLGEKSANAPASSTMNKEVATRDAAALDNLFLGRGSNEHVSALLDDFSASLTNDLTFVGLLDQHDLIQSGLDLTTGPVCPLCDTEWDLGKLRAHLKAKLDSAEECEVLRLQDHQKGEAAFSPGDVEGLWWNISLSTMTRYAVALGVQDGAQGAASLEGRTLHISATI